MIIKYSKHDSKKKYVFTSETSGYVTINEKMRLHMPEYMQSNVSVDQDGNNESSSGINN